VVSKASGFSAPGGRQEEKDLAGISSFVGRLIKTFVEC